MNYSPGNYTLILVFIIILLLFLPLFEDTSAGKIIISLAYLVLIVYIIRKLIRRLYSRHRFKNFDLGLAAIGFSSNITANLNGSTQLKVLFYLLTYTIYSIFFTLAIILMSRRLYITKKVTADIIIGGISVYLLLGHLWFLFYRIVYLIDPKAFFYSIERHDGLYLLIYYSFTTLTSLGYGDIVPINRIVMLLSNIEAIVGQLFPAIFIARLVSLFSAQELEKGDS